METITTEQLTAQWRIIAAVDYLSGESAIYRVLEGETLPAQYHDAGPMCQHCGQNRQRKTVYVLLSDSGEYRQVGSTCLHDFTGQDETELVRAFRDQLESDEDEHIRVSRLIGLEWYLSHVAMLIGEQGWLSTTAARETGRASTAERARNSMIDGQQPSAADIATAKRAITWAQAIPDDETNDYLHNLHVLAGESAIDPKHRNLSASMIVAHQRAQARDAERAQAAAVSKHFGEIGKRATFTLTVERVNSIATDYGVTNIHNMRDEAGNVAVWFATRECLEAGKTYTLKASVKKHDERNGIAQTVLTRCAVL